MRLDTTGTDADPGYDPIFQEPKLVSSADGLGTIGRQELPAILILGQFFEESDFMRLHMAADGNLAKSDVRIVFHFQDLEDAGLIENATGTSQIRVGDRLSAVYSKDGETLIQSIPTPPGLYIVKAVPLFGLDSTRNLLEVHFASRDPGKDYLGAGNNAG